MSEPIRDQLQSKLGDAYTLEGELSGGGMSRVFVAEDKALSRKIVVKVLPPETGAGVSVDRFKREIQVAARLQHPHIVPVLSAGEIGGLPFYTMPFVKGESLRTRISRTGEMSVNEAIHYLRDVAAALSYAHGEGVVHRDIKPDNVILSGGVAVVTDFGVSKAVDVAAAGSEHPSGAITSLGVALGTPAYMAPEQASADPRVDHRADIYSFGCLAYELLAGSSPFAGRPPQQLLAAHVTEAPEPLLRRRPNIPPALAALVMKCLQKRPGDRPQSGEELLVALDAIATPSGGMTPTSEHRVAARRLPVSWIAAGAGLAVIAALVFLLSTRRQPPSALVIGDTTPVAIGPELEGQPAISPDGKVVAYVAATPAGARIFVRQIDGGSARLLSPETDTEQASPSWSPDGSRISFVTNGGIYIVPALSGGAPKREIDAGATHSWSRDGKQIVYEGIAGIWLHRLDGGADTKVLNGGFLHSPQLSPDGRFVAYAEGRAPTLTNISSNVVWTVPVGGGTPTRISDSTHVNINPVWAPDGRSIFYLSNLGGTRDVYQIPVTSGGRPDGPATRVSTALSSFTISISADGSRLAYDVVHNFSNIFEVAIGASRSRIPSSRQITRESQHIEALKLSHDGKWVAYDSDRGGNFDIYKLRIDGGDPILVTTNPANDFGPGWSPDDKEIAFHTNRNGTRDIYVVSAEGTGERQVTSGPAQDYFPRFSPDGKQIAFASEVGPLYRYSAVSRGLDGRWSAPRPLTSTYTSGTSPDVDWSPDGKLIAYVSTDGLAVIPAAGGPPRILAKKDSLQHDFLSVGWSPDGRTVYVSSGGGGNGMISAYPVNGGPPRVVLAEEPGYLFGRWDFATDGARLFFTRGAFESDVWVMDLKH